MRKYTGTKTVKAEPMDELTAVEKGFARKNEDNHEWRNGYHVQYTNPDGSTYDSWSPKDVFEKTYSCSENYLDRLNIEFYEIDAKCKKLDEFIDTAKFKSLSMFEQTMLLQQLRIMQRYREILNIRFKNEYENV